MQTVVGLFSNADSTSAAMVKRKKRSVYLACCLQSSAKMAGVYFALRLHAGLRGRTEQNTGFDVLSLT